MVLIAQAWQLDTKLAVFTLIGFKVHIFWEGHKIWKEIYQFILTLLSNLKKGVHIFKNLPFRYVRSLNAGKFFAGLFILNQEIVVVISRPITHKTDSKGFNQYFLFEIDVAFRILMLLCAYIFEFFKLNRCVRL